MNHRKQAPDVAEKLVTELNSVDYTIGGILLLGVIMFFLAGGMLAKLGVSLVPVSLFLITGLILLFSRNLLITNRKQAIMRVYGLNCPSCNSTPGENTEARQALRTQKCPRCHSYYCD